MTGREPACQPKFLTCLIPALTSLEVRCGDSGKATSTACKWNSNQHWWYLNSESNGRKCCRYPSRHAPTTTPRWLVEGREQSYHWPCATGIRGANACVAVASRRHRCCHIVTCYEASHRVYCPQGWNVTRKLPLEVLASQREPPMQTPNSGSSQPIALVPSTVEYPRHRSRSIPSYFWTTDEVTNMTRHLICTSKYQR